MNRRDFLKSLGWLVALFPFVGTRVEKWRSAKIDLLWLDEPPPDRATLTRPQWDHEGRIFLIRRHGFASGSSEPQTIRWSKISDPNEWVVEDGST